MINKKEILLESGTNELEVVVFKVGDGLFAVNVAKVETILMSMPIVEVPNAHANVKGLINYRGRVLSVIDLTKALNKQDLKPADQKLMILTHINRNHFVIEVDEVIGIQRLSWNQIEAPSNMLVGEDKNMSITGIIKMENDDIILVLDLESILAETNTDLALKEGKLTSGLDGKRIVIAEDSAFLVKIIKKTFDNTGAIVELFNNGKEAWDYLRKIENPDDVHCVVTDIEMPVMDGLSLTKKIKDDKTLASIPVILFSSIVSDSLKHQGISVGADDQITKPEIDGLVKKVMRIRNK